MKKAHRERTTGFESWVLWPYSHNVFVQNLSHHQLFLFTKFIRLKFCVK